MTAPTDEQIVRAIWRAGGSVEFPRDSPRWPERRLKRMAKEGLIIGHTVTTSVRAWDGAEYEEVVTDPVWGWFPKAEPDHSGRCQTDRHGVCTTMYHSHDRLRVHGPSLPRTVKLRRRHESPTSVVIRLRLP